MHEQVAEALKNYAAYHDLPESAVTLDQVANDSGGIAGWATRRADDDGTGYAFEINTRGNARGRKRTRLVFDEAGASDDDDDGEDLDEEEADPTLGGFIVPDDVDDAEDEEEEEDDESDQEEGADAHN